MPCAPSKTIRWRKFTAQPESALQKRPGSRGKGYQAYLQYSLGLSRALPSYPGSALPAPTPLKGDGYSRAEILAHDLLAWGQCSLWEAVRQVVGHLCFEKPRHKNMSDQPGAHSFTIGIFARPQLVGLCKATLQHANTSKLLCHFVAHLCSSFRWTTLAIHLNYSAPVHRDFANSADQSLLALLREAYGLRTQRAGTFRRPHKACDRAATISYKIRHHLSGKCSVARYAGLETV